MPRLRDGKLLFQLGRDGAHVTWEVVCWACCSSLTWGLSQEMTLDEAYQRWWQKAKSNIQKALQDESKALGKLPGASGHVAKRLFPGGGDAYVRAPPQKMPRMHGALATAQKKMEFCPFLRKGTCLKGDKCDWSHGQADGAK